MGDVGVEEIGVAFSEHEDLFSIFVFDDEVFDGSLTDSASKIQHIGLAFLQKFGFFVPVISNFILVVLVQVNQIFYRNFAIFNSL